MGPFLLLFREFEIVRRRAEAHKTPRRGIIVCVCWFVFVVWQMLTTHDDRYGAMDQDEEVEEEEEDCGFLSFLLPHAHFRSFNLKESHLTRVKKLSLRQETSKCHCRS